mgnify:CR=1
MPKGKGFGERILLGGGKAQKVDALWDGDYRALVRPVWPLAAKEIFPVLSPAFSMLGNQPLFFQYNRKTAGACPRRHIL